MTLNITVVSRDAVYQSSDYRLTEWNARTGVARPFDTPADKQFPMFTYDWAASVCFTGIGRTRNVDVSEWLAETIARLAFTVGWSDLVAALLEADQWLRTVPRQHRHHTFTVAGFVGSSAKIALVSNWEHISGRVEEVPPDRLFVTSRTIRKPMVVVTGQRAAVSRQDRRLLAHTIPDVPEAPPVETRLPGGKVRLDLPAVADDHSVPMLNRLIAVNGRAAASPTSAKTVSAECFAGVVQRDGRAWFRPIGLAPDADYLPAFVLFRDIRKRVRRQPRALDEKGQPMPLRLVQMSAVRGSSGRIALAFEVTGLVSLDGL